MLSQAEVKQLFDSIRNLKYRALFMTAYAGGLRTSEVVRLRLTDIDSQRMVIRIRQGKGQKDRYVMLAPTLLKVLSQYWQQERPAPGSFRVRTATNQLVGIASPRCVSGWASRPA